MKWISWLLLMPSMVYAIPLKPNTHFRRAIPGEYIVRSQTTLSKTIGQQIGPNLYLVKGDLSQFKSLTDISPNYAYYGNYMENTPNDPQFINQFHHKMIQSQEAWNVSMGNEEVIVAVTDNEFELGHEDLKTAWFTNENEIPGNNLDDDSNGYVDDVIGWDFIDKDNLVSVTDDDNVGTHGSHVSGIIAARANNGVGVAGIAPQVKILPLRFYGGNNPWTSAVVAETYYYAVKMGAKIISTSYNIDAMSSDKVYVDAVKYATSQGLLVFNSAGNNNQKNPPRQNINELILVCSVQAKNEAVADLRSKFSNYGTGIDICAPGDPILSTVRGFYMGASRYGSLSGTSMATPAAAAVAALIWSHNPNFSAQEVREKLLSSVDDIYPKNLSFKGMLGSGRINALKALQ